jgi:GDP-D-mannose dehydratase
MSKTALITGQDGSYLAEFLLVKVIIAAAKVGGI